MSETGSQDGGRSHLPSRSLVIIGQRDCETLVLSKAVSQGSVANFMGPQRASQVVLVVKSLPANAGDLRNMGSIPGSGGAPG